MGYPFPCVALGDAGLGGEFGRGHRTALVQRAVQAEPVPQPDQRHAKRAAKIIEHAKYEFVQLGVVQHEYLLQPLLPPR